MDPRLRMQPGLVSDPSGQYLGRGGGLQGLSAYSLGLLQSQLGPEQARQHDLAQSRAQANANALRGAQGLGPSLSTGQGFYTVESLQGATAPRQDGLLGHAHDPSRSLVGGSYGGSGGVPQGLDAGMLNRLLAQQAANQKLVASTPSAGVGPFLYPSHSVPVDVNASTVGRGSSNAGVGVGAGAGYGYPPYAQTDASLAAARYAPQASLVSSDAAAILLRQRELQLQREREREKEKERERERERDLERERERARAKERERERERRHERERERDRERDDRERRRERARRDDIARERRRDIERRRERDRRLAIDKKRDADRRRERDREARADKDKHNDKKEKRSSLASPPADGDKEGKHTAIEKADKPAVKESDTVNEDNAIKKKVNAKVNTRNIKQKSAKPDSKADLSKDAIKDNTLLDKTSDEPEKVEAGVVQLDKTDIEVITGKTEMEVNNVSSKENVDENQSKFETIERIGELKTDEALKVEEVENAEGITDKARINEVGIVESATAVKVDPELSAPVLLDEKIHDEVKTRNVEEKIVLNQDTASGIPAQSKGNESVLGKRSVGVVGDASSAKKIRQPKGKGSGAAASAQPGTVRCEICKVTCRNAAVYETHLKGEKHAERLKKAQQQVPGNAAKALKAAGQAP